MALKELFQSAKAKGVLIGIAVVIFELLVFQAGMHVGAHRAAFSYRMGDNFMKTFGHHPRGPGGMPRGEFPNSHGTVGKIVKIELPTLVIEDRDRVEKIIVIAGDTAINRFRDTIAAADLKVGDTVVVIGSPNDESQIEAKLIRLLPEPPAYENR